MTKYAGKAVIQAIVCDSGDGVKTVSLAPDSMTMPKGTMFKIRLDSKAFRLKREPTVGMEVKLEVSDDRVSSVIDWN